MLFKITYPNKTGQIISMPYDENLFLLLNRVKKIIMEDIEIDIIQKVDEEAKRQT
jgi:hypothetical protein